MSIRRSQGARRASCSAVRAVEGIRADVFEDDINAFLLGDLAGLALEPVLAVVDHMIGTRRFHRLRSWRRHRQW